MTHACINSCLRFLVNEEVWLSIVSKFSTMIARKKYVTVKEENEQIYSKQSVAIWYALTASLLQF